MPLLTWSSLTQFWPSLFRFYFPVDGVVFGHIRNRNTIHEGAGANINT